MVPCLTAEVLRGAGLRHGFFGRRGGVSRGPFASLNVGLRGGDDPAAVRENRRRIADTLGIPLEALVTARQVHGTTALLVAAPFDPDRLPEADALVVERPGLAIGVTTADCAPVLLMDPIGLRAAAIHAGWRGLLHGVIERTVELMAARGTRPSELRAAIGPCIGPTSYEVGPELEDAFRRRDPAFAAHFRPVGASDRRLFDLPGAVRRVLLNCGLEAGRVQLLGRDTCREEADWFSCRRSRLRGEGRFGLQLSALVLSLPHLEEETTAASTLHQTGEDHAGNQEP